MKEYVSEIFKFSAFVNNPDVKIIHKDKIDAIILFFIYFTYNKNHPKGVDFYYISFLKNQIIFAVVVTCGIIKTSTVDLFLCKYSSDWSKVTQTTVVCPEW